MPAVDVCRLLSPLVGGPRPWCVALLSAIISVVAIVLALYRHTEPVETTASYPIAATVSMTKVRLWFSASLPLLTDEQAS